MTIIGTDGRVHHLSSSCWYCGCDLIRTTGSRSHPLDKHPRRRTKEHLIPRSTTRKSKYASITNHPDNLRSSCQRCNTFVGSHDIETKLKFRVFIREVGWDELDKCNYKHRDILKLFKNINPPQDFESVIIRERA